MALYAIGDPHLHYSVQLKKSMTSMGPAWKDHEARLKREWTRTVSPEDTVVVCGDISFGRNEAECQRDFAFLSALPGRKILLRGNHDAYWEVKKTPALNRSYRDRFFFLQNNHAEYGPVALVGTKGYAWEGHDTPDHARELTQRELERLECSFQSAADAGFSRFIVFLHYPPTDLDRRHSLFCKCAENWGAEQVVYAHCHGASRFGDSLTGVHRGIAYRLVSGDFVLWRPQKLLD